MKKPKVLIVEDDLVWMSRWLSQLTDLGTKFEMVIHYSQTDALTAFKAVDDWDLIVVDACVPGHSPNTLDLIREVRQKYAGPMVAISTDFIYRQRLIDAGCDYYTEKRHLIEKIYEILKL